MAKRTTNTYLQVEVVDDSLQLSLRDICKDCGVHAETVIKLVEHGVLQPRGRSPGQWEFVGRDLLRTKRAIRLQRDLAVNLAGAALTLDLLDEIESLRRRLQRSHAAPDTELE